MAYLPALQSSHSLSSVVSSQLTLATTSTGPSETSTLHDWRSTASQSSQAKLGTEHSEETRTALENQGTFGRNDSQATLIDHLEHQLTDEKWSSRLLRRVNTRRQQAFHSSWQPSWIRAGPLLGITALAFIIVSIAVHAAVLAVSNGQAVERWTVQPSVYISVLTGIGNKALGFAALQGAIITWWVRALKGTTLAQLHYDWPLGVNIFSWSRRHISLLTVTSICAVVITIDGVLLQSATTSIERPLDQSVQLAVKLSPEIPTNYTATGSLLNVNNTYLNADVSSEMAPIWHEWISELPIPSPIHGCKGICAAKVRAAAVDLVGCRSEPDQPMNYTAIRLNNTSLPFSCQKTGYKIRCMLFEVQVQPSAAVGPYETIDVSVGKHEVSPDEQSHDCAGQYTWKTCSFRSAIAEYDVITYNDSFVKTDTTAPRILETAGNTGRAIYEVNDTLSLTIGGIGLLASMDLYTSIGMWAPGEDLPYTDNINTWQASLMKNADQFHAREHCVPNWRDPMEDITTTLNALMFRTSIHAARSIHGEAMSTRLDPGSQVEYQVDGLRIDAQPVFHTRWPFFWAAASVQVVCVLLVLITYRRYWLLGRTMSLSPLEIARAFDAPVMETFPRAKSGSALDELSNIWVKYSARAHRSEDTADLEYSFVVDGAGITQHRKQALPLGD